MLKCGVAAWIDGQILLGNVGGNLFPRKNFNARCKS